MADMAKEYLDPNADPDLPFTYADGGKAPDGFQHVTMTLDGEELSEALANATITPIVRDN